MKENLLSKLTHSQLLAVCKRNRLGNEKLLNTLSRNVIISDYILKNNVSYSQIVKSI